MRPGRLFHPHPHFCRVRLCGAEYRRSGHVYGPRWKGAEAGIFADDMIAQLPALRRYAAGLAGRTGEADDLVQDCIERALRRPDALQNRVRMGAWLRSILHNLFVDELRRRRGRGSVVDVRDMEDDLALSAPPQDSSGVRDFGRAMAGLSVEHRQILLLVGVEGLSYRQVADELAIPAGTVMSRLARARAALRQALEASENPVSRGRAAQ